MNQDYIIPNEWSIIENEFNADRVKSSESLFSLGNGAMGQRANFEEDYSGATFQGSYIAGVYYPDKTRVGWWKNGYPNYFAKVLNAPNWIGLSIKLNGETLDLNSCQNISEFNRELNMKEGWLSRSFVAKLQNGLELKVNTKRFLSITHDELGAIEYQITPLSENANLDLASYIDGGITNEDTNWEDKFWQTLSVEAKGNEAFIVSKTNKTEFHTCTFNSTEFQINGQKTTISNSINKQEHKISLNYKYEISQNNTLTIYKYGGYVADRTHKKEDLVAVAKKKIETAHKLQFSGLLKEQIQAWAKIWEMADITISGDVKAQQGIRFNIFHLNQTYLGKDASLNIGPKGFTGEKYGGSTYWDTEAYCIPFYMATKNDEVAKNLLHYRYNHLGKAIENAEKLGFKNGAALYPMVTMNGEECHNEWEITFEEIHRNGAIAYAIFNYTRYTNDYSYLVNTGIEVLIGIARFWKQRANFSTEKNKYVILGVTGPNEYENNINNNWYTNYLAKWCLQYALEQIQFIENEYSEHYKTVVTKTNLLENELSQWKEVSENMYFPFDDKLQVYLQQDGFLDKELITVDDLDKSDRPINQKWSWDRILRSPYIKQADVLQGFYFFEEHFSKESLEKHYNFYEPFTVHESSLSPCVHSILAAKLDKIEQAYTFYLRTSRLDLDDYNHEVHEGLHITSMAGTWMSIVEGFGGMRIKNNALHFEPRIPSEWNGYSFKINFRNTVIKVEVTQKDTKFSLEGDKPLKIFVFGKEVLVEPNHLVIS